MNVNLRPGQVEAIRRLRNGCILNGSVGSGKSRTSLAYYYILNWGEIDGIDISKNSNLLDNGTVNSNSRIPQHRDLYIITTARKRDTKEWEDELKPFDLDKYCHELRSDDIPMDGGVRDDGNPHCRIVIDSWNNIKKYSSVKDAFFILDEQRVVGYGAWTKAFLKIARNNQWIMLSATPGDTWSDYIPVFIANGFYRNKTEFNAMHVVFSKFTTFPKIDRYVGTRRLERLRDYILVDIPVDRDVVKHSEVVYTDYNTEEYRKIMKTRWNPIKGSPIETASEFCTLLRRVCNADPSRGREVAKLVQKHKKAIIFYNFDYELEILLNLDYGVEGLEVAQWNGHKHESIPTGDAWVYLVNYVGGSEAWNCITTDTIIFYSQNYSYRTVTQAMGRTDRMNTPYKDLYYYHLRTHSSIDLAITKALRNKKNFNERMFDVSRNKYISLNR